MANRFEEALKVRSGEEVNEDFFNRRYKDLDNRLDPLERRAFTEDLVFDTVSDRVLARSEAVIASLRDQLVEITQLEFLTGQSGTARTLVEGQSISFIIDPVDRALFAPGPWAVVMRDSTPDDYAIVRKLAYDRAYGQFDVMIYAVVGDPGPHDDWSIAAVAGSTLAQRALLDQGKTARDAAAGSAEAAADDAEATAADRAAIALHRAVVTADREAADASAQAAAVSADAAARLAAGTNFLATSPTSKSLALGTCTIVLSPGDRAKFVPSQYLAMVSAADPRNAQTGIYSNYDPITGTLTLNVFQYSGSGSFADWMICPTPPPYAAGGVDGGYANETPTSAALSIAANLSLAPAAIISELIGALPKSDVGLLVGALWSNGGILTRVEATS